MSAQSYTSIPSSQVDTPSTGSRPSVESNARNNRQVPPAAPPLSAFTNYNTEDDIFEQVEEFIDYLRNLQSREYDYDYGEYYDTEFICKYVVDLISRLGRVNSVSDSYYEGEEEKDEEGPSDAENNFTYAEDSDSQSTNTALPDCSCSSCLENLSEPIMPPQYDSTYRRNSNYAEDSDSDISSTNTALPDCSCSSCLEHLLEPIMPARYSSNRPTSNSVSETDYYGRPPGSISRVGGASAAAGGQMFGLRFGGYTPGTDGRAERTRRFRGNTNRLTQRWEQEEPLPDIVPSRYRPAYNNAVPRPPPDLPSLTPPPPSTLRAPHSAYPYQHGAGGNCQQPPFNNSSRRQPESGERSMATGTNMNHYLAFAESGVNSVGVGPDDPRRQVFISRLCEDFYLNGLPV